MKKCYLKKLDGVPAIADLSSLTPMVGLGFPEGTLMINRINVPAKHRGERIGSELLDEICSDADTEHITLVLWPMPSGGLNRRQLEAWYKRRGFSWTRDRLFMVRSPNG